MIPPTRYYSTASSQDIQLTKNPSRNAYGNSVDGLRDGVGGGGDLGRVLRLLSDDHLYGDGQGLQGLDVLYCCEVYRGGQALHGAVL